MTLNQPTVTEAIEAWATMRVLAEDVSAFTSAEAIEKIAVWMPISVEAIIDAGGWDSLTPAEQRRYLAEQAKLERWSRSWRGRWFHFTQAFDRIAHRLARWPQPDPEWTDDE